MFYVNLGILAALIDRAKNDIPELVLPAECRFCELLLKEAARELQALIDDLHYRGRDKPVCGELEDMA